MENPLKTKVVIRFNAPEIPDVEFANARVTIQPPFIVVSNDAEQLGFFPIGSVAGVVYPEGSNKVQL